MEPIKVLIADDESIVRKGLIATVDWAKYGMEVVADVPNGAKGWEAFQRHEPEIVVTDIVMPEMDGIDLTRKIKEASPDTKILLLSCHRDFEYAQQGIRLGVAGYLLKTAFEEDELDRYLSRFRSEIDLARRHATDSAAMWLEAAGTVLATGEGQRGGAASEPASDDSGRWEALLCAWLYGAQSGFEAELERRWQAGWGWMDEPHYIYLVQGEAAAAGSIREPSPPHASVPYGRDRRFYMVAEQAAKLLDEALAQAKAHEPGLRWRKEGPIAGREAWLAAAAKLHRKAELEAVSGMRTDGWPEPLVRAVRLVAEDLKQPWTGSDVADRVGLSRSHFSTMFKKVTGESFVHFLFRMRLEKSYELLAESELTLQEIAECVGMIDGKYFSKWFKRCCGLTPSQYRTKQKAESDATK